MIDAAESQKSVFQDSVFDLGAVVDPWRRRSCALLNGGLEHGGRFATPAQALTRAKEVIGSSSWPGLSQQPR
jgi:hypothetical protein